MAPSRARCMCPTLRCRRTSRRAACCMRSPDRRANGSSSTAPSASARRWRCRRRRTPASLRPAISPEESTPGRRRMDRLRASFHGVPGDLDAIVSARLRVRGSPSRPSAHALASWPGLSRPSTRLGGTNPRRYERRLGVDGRDKHGHDRRKLLSGGGCLEPPHERHQRREADLAILGVIDSSGIVADRRPCSAGTACPPDRACP